MTGHHHEDAKRPGTYRLSVYLGKDQTTGKPRYKTFSFKTTSTGKQAKAEVERELRRRIQEVEAGEHAPGREAAPAEATVATFAERWLTEYVERRLAAGKLTEVSAQGYRYAVSVWITPLLGEFKLASLKPDDVAGFLTRMGKADRQDGRPGNVGGNTVRAAYAVLRNLLNYAWDLELIARNPCTRRTAPVLGKRQAKEVADEAGVLRLAALARGSGSPWLALAILLGGTCGLRRGEVCGLRWENVDLDRGTLSVREALSAVRGKPLIVKPPKTLSSVRCIALPPLLIEELRGRQQPAGYVLHGRNGQPITVNCLSSTYQDFKDAYGVTMTMQGLRRSHGSQLADAGVAPKAVASRLGHSEPSTTLAFYTELLDGADGAVAQIVEQRYRKALNGNGAGAAGTPAINRAVLEI